jgi:transcription elongation factor GreA
VKDVILTPEGYKQLTGELDVLRTSRRREIAERIAAAREFGEIAENAEYDDAKNEQMMLEHRISQLEERLANAQVIDKKRVDTSVVSIGAVVRLRDVDAKETTEYFIVGSAEANPAENKLSNESPVGKAIMGRKKGETGRGRHSAWLEGEVQDHGDQGRVAGCVRRPRASNTIGDRQLPLLRRVAASRRRASRLGAP